MLPSTKKTLFWDTNIDNLDLSKHKRFIIERILKFGDLSDYFWLKNVYLFKEISEVISRDRTELDKKSLNFWSNLYKVRVNNTHASRDFK